MFSVLNVSKKAMFSLSIMAMTAVHLDWLCFSSNVTLPQLRSQNIVICNNPIADDTGKADDIGKADTYSAVMMPAQILSWFLWIL